MKLDKITHLKRKLEFAEKKFIAQGPIPTDINSKEYHEYKENYIKLLTAMDIAATEVEEMEYALAFEGNGVEV